MNLGQEKNIDLLVIRKRGVLQVKLEGKIYRAPFSQKNAYGLIGFTMALGFI